MKKFIILVLIFVIAQAMAEKVKVLCDFTTDPDVDYILKSDSTISVVNGKLRITAGTQAPWPGITVPATGGVWNLTGYRFVSVEITNTSSIPLTFLMRVDNPGTDGTTKSRAYDITIAAGATGTLSTELYLMPFALTENLNLIGMQKYPSKYEILDPSNVNRVLLFIPQTSQQRTFEIGNITAVEDVAVIASENFLPFVDEFGQFIHYDWPGKVHSAQELAQSIAQEQLWLEQNPGPASFSVYGGWKDGPRFDASGRFTTRKVDGKWWFVDPEGYLFWSNGVDCVEAKCVTPVQDRTNYFASLPQEQQYLQFFSIQRQSAHGYYSTIDNYLAYDFYKANLYRKFSTGWADSFADMAHKRLRSWGMNTIGNWSDITVYDDHRTPYVLTLEFMPRPIVASEGYWGPFYDIFDPSFTKMLREQIRRFKPALTSSWCIGVFVHNELSWGDQTSLAIAVLKSPSDQAAKKVFLNDLKNKYTTIENLNQAWNGSYKDWPNLLTSQAAPADLAAADADLKAFNAKLTKTYFKTVKELLSQFAPQTLYLGCRFAWDNPAALKAAVDYCDVVSFNHYQNDVGSLAFLGTYDKPVIIGEFHFGATDRGMFNYGVKSARNQTERADKYRAYMRSALTNADVVGAHWFQYVDQPVSGRTDGENFGIGLVDICDNPYAELIEAAKEIGYGMYQYRSSN